MQVTFRLVELGFKRVSANRLAEAEDYFRAAAIQSHAAANAMPCSVSQQAEARDGYKAVGGSSPLWLYHLWSAGKTTHKGHGIAYGIAPDRPLMITVNNAVLNLLGLVFE